MDNQVKASTNWNLTGGQDIVKAIKTNVTHEDIFIKPTLDEILSDDGAILLSHPEEDNTASLPCEFHIRVFPRFKIESLSMVCTAAKAELFIGKEMEYNETLYGNVIEEDTDNVEDKDQTLNIGSYRYDIEINKSGIIDIMLKLLTNAREICIFGIVLNIAPNPNGITTLMPNAINLANVQEILNSSKSKLSPNAEKCKLFMQMYKSSCQPTASGQDSMQSKKLMEMLENMISNKPSSSPSAKNECVKKAEEANILHANSVDILDNLKAYIDIRLSAFETKVLDQLASFEKGQSSKLDKILELLEKKS